MPKSKFIYIPQGRGGEIDLQTQNTGIKGLYTDGFSTCLILVARSATKAALFHIDSATHPNPLLDYLKSHAFTQYDFYYRKEYDYVVGQQYVGFFETDAVLCRRPITQHGLNAKDNTMGISVECVTHSPNPFVCKTYNDTLSQVLYHPQAIELETVQKIEGLVGLHARVITRTMKAKQLLVFADTHFKPVPKDELNPDQSHPLTQNEMQSFRKEDHTLGLAQKIHTITVKAQAVADIPIAGSLNTHSKECAYMLGYYLNDYNPYTCLLLDLNEFSTLPTLEEAAFIPMDVLEVFFPTHPADQTFMRDLKALSSSQSNEAQHVQAIKMRVREYRASTHETPYKKDMLIQLKHVLEFYDERTMAHEARAKQALKLEKATKASSEGVTVFQTALKIQDIRAPEREAQLKVAGQHFKHTLRLLHQAVCEDHIDFAKNYYNLGRCLQERGLANNNPKHLARAKTYLEKSLTYYQMHPRFKGLQDRLETINKHINTCTTALSTPDQSSNSHKQPSPIQC